MTAGGAAGGETDVRRGLAHFMERVLAEREKVLAGFEPDPVHDLRVAIRRCRSLAWGMRLVDPHPGWRRLNRDGRTLFRVLGELRDTQVLMDLVRRIGPKGDPAGAALAARLRQAEARQVQTARAVLEVFPVREWKVLAQTLHPRVRRLEPDGPFFEYLAARLLENAFAVHRRALRTRNPVVWHELRIAIKRFRYVVESFLPRRLARWERPLKSLQDLLGEVHDLHVLWGALGHLGPVFDARARSRWRRLVERGQRARMRRYRKWMTGRRAHWDVWQGDLPSRAERGRSARARLAVWFEYADPAPARTRRAAAVALRLFDQLAALDAGNVFRSARARRLLETAALCRSVAGSGRLGSRRKAARRVRNRLPRLVEWRRPEIDVVALLVRRHAGRPPWLGDRRVAGLSTRERATFLPLAAVLRLAVVLDAADPRGASGLRVRRTARTFVIETRSITEGPLAARLALERAGLEVVLGRRVVVSPAVSLPRGARPARTRA